MLKQTLPVLMAGGSGSRLWPLSRRHHPKQFLPLLNDSSLLENTLARLPKTMPKPVVICHESQRFMAAEALRQHQQAATIILEAESKNTAATAALAAWYAESQHYEQIALFPADHYLADHHAFAQDLNTAASAAGQQYLATFGITPTHADTGFGYIQAGSPLKATSAAFHIEQFIEKPELARAEQLVAAGNYYWNSGMFILPTGLFLQELEKFAPEIFHNCQKAWQQRSQSLDFIRPDAGHFGQCPSISIDYAVMEKSRHGIVMPVTWQWSDIGSWQALFQLGEKDAENNVAFGDVVSLASKNNYLRSEHRLVATFGIEDLIVIETADAVLVLPQSQSAHLKQLLEQLKGRKELENHREVARPWGSYECIDEGSRFQVKRLTLNPGAQISLQKHHHRSEHWVVVTGTAEITCDDKVFLLTENQSTYIPLGSTHRLRNPGKIPLEIIEVQSGSYLGEDDIVRFEDTYGRVQS